MKKVALLEVTYAVVMAVARAISYLAKRWLLGPFVDRVCRHSLCVQVTHHSAAGREMHPIGCRLSGCAEPAQFFKWSELSSSFIVTSTGGSSYPVRLL
jgi:hypothetical protein